MTPDALFLLILSVWLFNIGSASSTDLHSEPNATKNHPHKKRRAEDCDCFTVTGPDPGYFQHYKLWDFRSIPGVRQAHFNASTLDEQLESIQWPDSMEEGTDDENDDVSDENEYPNDDEEDELANKMAKSNANVDTEESELEALWSFKKAFEKDWVSQQWQRPSGPHAPVTMINSKRNVFFAKNREWLDHLSTYLVMRTTRHRNYTSTAEIETKARNIFHCSLRVRFRVLPANLDSESTMSHSNGITHSNEDLPYPGSCVGIFTYREPNCESDIELLTKDPPSRIHYANQPDYDFSKDMMIPGANTVMDLPVPWTTWSVHRLDWLSNVSRWWADGEAQDSKTYRVPDLPSWLMINLWSDGGVWTGDLPLGDSVFMAIEYIEVAYNISADDWQKSPPPMSQRHGGHQYLASGNVASLAEGSHWPEADSEPSAEIIDGAMFKKCKKGRKGRKCRKNRKKKKHGKKPKHPHQKHRPSRCERMCNIDEWHFANGGLMG
ncbi:hypothetical protein POX_d05166 [Penicillium oxalicum]|uniref:hypothetical protein n=1 Tax=Penicillium oxalicum TaxID=69781 RepID=UPI0020B6FC86|nr:hypothetical protein POX_d05166 [Penicillium oxalicum]KAI2789671.1 hypothetical protein POX_d05166 [Penicillium oxalicum]